MNRKMVWVLMLTLFVSVPAGSFLHAEEEKQMGMMGGMRGKKMMGGKMMGMGMMMGKSVVATSDGGIVVVAGNKITKYDQDLNVVKEVDIKMDMKGMMENCPMMKGMGDEAEAPSESAVDETPAASEHESHH